MPTGAGVVSDGQFSDSAPGGLLSPDGKVLVKVSVPSGTAQLSPLSLRATVQTQ